MTKAFGVSSLSWLGLARGISHPLAPARLIGTSEQINPRLHSSPAGGCSLLKSGFSIKSEPVLVREPGPDLGTPSPDTPPRLGPSFPQFIVALIRRQVVNHKFFSMCCGRSTLASAIAWRMKATPCHGWLGPVRVWLTLALARLKQVGEALADLAHISAPSLERI
jgi:hypothetical protein